MNYEMEKNNYCISWLGFILGILLLIAGTIALMDGINAYQNVAIIPPTTKSGWMSGPHSMVVGAMMLLVGTGLLANEAIKSHKRNQ
jgi:hypothetical protein